MREVVRGEVVEQTGDADRTNLKHLGIRPCGTPVGHGRKKHRGDEQPELQPQGGLCLYALDQVVVGQVVQMPGLRFMGTIPILAGDCGRVPGTGPGNEGPPLNSEHRMERQEILERLKALIHERFGIDPAGISGKTTQSELGIDSLLMVDMMLDVETELDMSFESMELPRNPDMDTIVDLVKRNMDRGA